MNVYTNVVGTMSTNCYLIEKNEDILIIDPGDDAEYITRSILDKGKPVGILLTHGHFDHMLAAYELKLAFGIPLIASNKDNFLLVRSRKTAKYFMGIDPVIPSPKYFDIHSSAANKLAQLFEFKIDETPGHTPGSVSYSFTKSKIIFVGDLLFKNGLSGSADHAYSSQSEISSSIQRLIFEYGGYTAYPGHGASFKLAKSYLIQK